MSGYLSLIVLACVAVFVTANPAQRLVKRQVQIPAEAATINFSNVDQLLQNKSFLRAQLACVYDIGGCDGIGKTLKAAILEFKKSGSCRPCTADQTATLQKVSRFLKKNYPEEYDRVNQKYGIVLPA